MLTFWNIHWITNWHDLSLTLTVVNWWKNFHFLKATYYQTILLYKDGWFWLFTKGWLQTVKLRPLVEIKLARPIRSQYFKFSINKPQDQSFFFLVQKHHVWTVLICFSNLKCGDKSVTVETGDVSWGEGRPYLLFLIVDEWNITWSRPYLITFFVKHCVQIHDSWRFQGILELPMWTT